MDARVKFALNVATVAFAATYLAARFIFSQAFGPSVLFGVGAAGFAWAYAYRRT
jgi:hypothetical protein